MPLTSPIQLVADAEPLDDQRQEEHQAVADMFWPK